MTLAVRPTRPDSGAAVVAVSWTQNGPGRPWRPGTIPQASASHQCRLDPARGDYYGDLIESTTRLEPGFSGGPPLDSSGYPVAVNVACWETAAGGDSRGYAIPLDEQTLRSFNHAITAQTPTFR